MIMISIRMLRSPLASPPGMKEEGEEEEGNMNRRYRSWNRLIRGGRRGGYDDK